MQFDIFSKLCVGPVINCFILNDVSKESSCAPSGVVMSWFDQFLDLAMKLLINSTKSEWPLEMLEISFSRLARNPSNLSEVWVSDRYKEPHKRFYYWQKLQKLIIHSNTNLIYNMQVEIFKKRHTHNNSPYTARMIISNVLVTFDIELFTFRQYW